MILSKCLYCYQSLTETEQDFHTACAKKMFGTKLVPRIGFDLSKVEELAKQIVVKSITVTGVQPKLSLEIEKYKNELSRLTIVGLYGHFILKTPSTDYNELPENEDLTMHLANLVKIETAQHCLIRLHSGELAYLTKRFDRKGKDKIAVEDFCQLTENLTEHKYRGSIEKLAKTTQKFTTNKGLETLRLFELVLFCYLTGNADMHLKNFSLVENAFGEFELSPAYDLVNTALVIADDQEETALTINGKKSRLGKKDFDDIGTRIGIGPKVLQNIYTKFEKVLPNWIEFIEQSFLSREMQKSYIDILQTRHKNLFHL